MDRARLSRFVNQELREFRLGVPLFVSATEPVDSALRKMRAASQSCVLVGDAGHLAGIFTERDVLTECMHDGFDWSQPIGEALVAREPRTIASDRSLAEAIATFQQHSYRTLPVVDGGRVVGLIRVSDVLAHVAEAFPEEILNLPPRPHQVMEKQEGG
jgi:CBS domain-containing protein